jgi:hypothetical protein
MYLKVSPKGRHIFERLRPQQHRIAVDVTLDSGANHSASLSHVFQGQVRKVVL